jgi:3-phenylpropionate/trans-cinnamate dioxygenase ferredoxin subunit
MTEVRLCSVGDVPDGEARRFPIGRGGIALVHIDDAFYAIDDTCSHQKISLSEGEVHADKLEIECWKHGSCFSLVDGTPNTLPATRPVATYDVRIDDDDVLVVLP